MNPAQLDKDPRSMAGSSIAGAGQLARRRMPILVLVFILTIVIPPNVSLFLGTMRLSPYRIVLLLAIMPCIAILFSGRAGKINVVDILMVLHALWTALALFVVHTVDEIWQFAGMNSIEALMPYMLARCYIRSYEDFRRVAILVTWLVIAILPFTFYESVTGHHIIRDAARSIFGGITAPTMEPRLGLNRASGPFEHPILYGVFCASVIGINFYLIGPGRTRIVRWFKTGLVMLATFFSLSSGALIGMIIQLLLIFWDHATRHIRNRWLILGMLFAAAWIFVSFASTRHPIVVFVYYLTFSAETAYDRLRIWDYGTAEVARHPIFGIGLHEFQHIWWMSSSMDNFWLVEAVRYGLPGFLLFAAACLIIYFKIGRLIPTDMNIRNCRNGLLISLVGMTFAGTTVHFWNALYVYFIFLLGSAIWLFDMNAQKIPQTDRSRAPHAGAGSV